MSQTRRTENAHIDGIFRQPVYLYGNLVTSRAIGNRNTAVSNLDQASDLKCPQIEKPAMSQGQCHPDRVSCFSDLYQSMSPASLRAGVRYPGGGDPPEWTMRGGSARKG